MKAADPWIVERGALVLAVRLTPRGGRDEIDGIETLADGRCVIKARVRAAPSEGEANAALKHLFAKALKVPSSRISIVSGAATRIKRLRIEGEGPALAAAMGRIVGEADSAQP